MVGTMILERLKAETAPLHEEIERTVDVFRPGFDLAAYRGLLGRFLGFYEPMEDRLGRVDDKAFRAFFEPRRKAGLLQSDLLALGLDREAVAALPRCVDLPPCDGLAGALGVGYVMEGATLGGTLISKHVEKTFGLTPGEGDAYFRPYGDRTGAMWDEFRSMCARRAGEVDADAVVAAACATFDRLGAWLGRRL
jgi:heme oxygenase